MEANLSDLPENVQAVLKQTLEKVREALGGNLNSVVLFGSAAEGKLRQTSDVNLMLVLNEFNIDEADRIRESIRFAHSAIKLNVMFIKRSEIQTASQAFAVKFSDILKRHRILFGENPFVSVSIDREAKIHRLHQVIVNLMLRMRERYVMLSLREEQLAKSLAEFSGPIRSASAAYLQLRDIAFTSPKEAMQIAAKDVGSGKWDELLSAVSAARETGGTAVIEASRAYRDLISFTSGLSEKILALK